LKVLCGVLKGEQLSVVISPIADSTDHLFVIKPSDPFPIFPKTVPQVLSLRSLVGPESMLFATIPVPNVDSSVSPLIDTESMLLIFLVLTLITSPITPLIAAYPIHVVVLPLTFVASAI
jgi:hypothetical protein